MASFVLHMEGLDVKEWPNAIAPWRAAWRSDL